MNQQHFQSRYKNLNPAQKQAVDTIEGPVLVVAGPGSGKTELLSIRVANILQKTDTLPSSILCLTFTDAAAANMQHRLSQLIGSAAYKVAIHTFHSFAASVINQYPEYFHKGAVFNPADALIQTEILNNILEQLSVENPLRKLITFQGYSLVESIKQKIQDLKSAGIKPEQFSKILQENNQFLQHLNPHITETFAPKISKNNQHLYQSLLQHIQSYNSQDTSKYSIQKHYLDTFSFALTQASQSDKFQTKPITAWKNSYTKKDKENNHQLKDFANQEKLLATAQVYKAYQQQLHQLGYFDFADLILEVLRVLKQHPDVRYDLQEKYLYLLVDEFQDTNGVQNEIVNHLLNLEVTDGRPNILAVGDDDQAIYKFQGAKIQNILSFNETYKNPQLIVLNNNYRSTQDILDLSRGIITQSEERLETRLPQVTKNLISKNSNLKPGTIHYQTFPDYLTELHYISEQISSLVQNGEKYQDIAIISTKHRLLEDAAKLLLHQKIPVSYERKKSILDKKPIQELLLLLKFINSLNKTTAPAYDLLPEILSLPFLAFDRTQIWQLSIKAYQERENWLTIMLQDPTFSPFAEFLIHLGSEAMHLTAEQILDLLTGSETFPSINFHSPFKQFYFSNQNLQQNPHQYLDFLEALKTFFSKIRQHTNQETIKTSDLLQFVELHTKYSIPLNYTTSTSTDQHSVQLLTAHSCKGLEFKTVFIINADDKTWASTRRSSLINFPTNLQISSEQDTLDDKLRLFYVALTRAKENLFITSSLEDKHGRTLKPLRFLTDLELPENQQQHTLQNRPELTKLFFDTPTILTKPQNYQKLLEPLVKNYKLSATHFNNFLNVIDGGPQKFLQQNLLRFPQAKPPAAAYGSAIHQALHLFHYHYSKHKKLPPITKLLELFEQSLTQQNFNQKDHQDYSKKGQKYLENFYNHFSFNPLDHSEYDFRTEGIKIQDALLTGTIDRLNFDQENKQINISDYKTGKPLFKWQTSNPYEQIKAWKYQNQLIFYKLLVENSRSFSHKYQVHKTTLEFIESPIGELKTLDLHITPEQIQETTALINIVYNKITSLDFPDTSNYPPDFMGIQLFKEDLLASWK